MDEVNRYALTTDATPICTTTRPSQAITSPKAMVRRRHTPPLFLLCGTFMLSPLLRSLMCIAFGLVIACLRALIPPLHGSMRRQAPSYVPVHPKTATCVSRPQDLSRDDALLGPRRRQSTRRRSQSGRLLVGHHEQALGPPRAAGMRPPAHPPRLCSICPRILALLRLSDVHLTCLPTLLPACLRPQAHGMPRRWQRGLTLDDAAHGGADERRIRCMIR